ncbi:hypothetical protein GCM10010218_47070 [Streptomyces mashuensis]|uniref:Integral membrane protein n=1 Tax=Streptomyces mashuensis TaxID=33904 RepID=A0A919B691_9ACTN|nr:DUF6113 family protein [Streptomyces mashuensis]GHF60261.1 hypothetical protein GCM10010218_47070 [Streptomyces mashuensis]
MTGGQPMPFGRVKWGRVALCLGLALLGLVTGVAGSLVQAGWFPGGLLLALLALTGVCYGGATLTRSRAGAASAGAGWLVAVVYLSLNRPEGDYLLGAGLGTYVYLLGGMIVAVMCATVPKAVQPGGFTARLGK